MRHGTARVGPPPRYADLATRLPHNDYVQAARSAFEALTPQQREEIAATFRTLATQHGVTVPSAQSASAEPSSLAQAAGDVHAQQPDLVQQLFAPNGAFASPAAKSALLGITAFAAKRLTASGR